MNDGKQKTWMGEGLAKKRLHSLLTERFHPVLQNTCIWSISVTQIPPPDEKWHKCLAFKYFSDQETKHKFPSICFWNSDAEGKRKPASVKEPIKCHGQQDVNIAQRSVEFLLLSGAEVGAEAVGGMGRGAAAEACVVCVEVLLGEVWMLIGKLPEALCQRDTPEEHESEQENYIWWCCLNNWHMTQSIGCVFTYACVFRMRHEISWPQICEC